MSSSSLFPFHEWFESIFLFWSISIYGMESSGEPEFTKETCEEFSKVNMWMKTETMNMHLLLDLNAHHIPKCFLIWKSLLSMTFGKSWKGKEIHLVLASMGILMWDYHSQFCQRKRIGYAFKNSQITVVNPSFADDITLAASDANDCQQSINTMQEIVSWTKTMSFKASKCRQIMGWKIF